MGIAVVTGAARASVLRSPADWKAMASRSCGSTSSAGTALIACDVADHAQVGEVAATVAADVGPVDVARQTTPGSGASARSSRSIRRLPARARRQPGRDVPLHTGVRPRHAGPRRQHRQRRVDRRGRAQPRRRRLLAVEGRRARVDAPDGDRMGTAGSASQRGGSRVRPHARHRRGVRRPRGPRVRSGVVPLRRLGTPADIAGAVAFLAGPDSAYITGQVIYVDGGVTQSLMTMIPRPSRLPGPHVEH